MLLLALIVGVSLLFSAVTRWAGAPPLLAFALPVLPALAAFVYFAIHHDLEIGPHGGILPAWMVSGVVLLMVSAASFMAVRGVRRRGPEEP